MSPQGTRPIYSDKYADGWQWAGPPTKRDNHHAAWDPFTTRPLANGLMINGDWTHHDVNDWELITSAQGHPELGVKTWRGSYWANWPNEIDKLLDQWAAMSPPARAVSG